MVGPPGTAKSMLARRLAGLLPPLSHDEALESAAILSVAGAFAVTRWGERVLRAPHHTASAAALVGGGSPPRPGEASLAHHGVLFLDELEVRFPGFVFMLVGLNGLRGCRGDGTSVDNFKSCRD